MKKHDPIQNTLAVILAGGSGTRLQPLTDWCAKPAIPFGGKFRTIDFTLSNCLHSDIRKICILTQYKSHSLNQHIQRGWNFLQQELGEFVELIPAQQRVKCQWYQGTADALFQNLDIFQAREPEYVLVLAGDHVYTMDYADMIRQHVATGSDLTVGCVEVPLADASAFGVMGVDADNSIVEFAEKPLVPRPLPGRESHALASMGIYIFNTEFLYRQLVADALDETSTHDFGRDIIPSLIGKARVRAFPFRDARTGRPGYWRDVGTLDSYYESNLELCKVTPALNLYDKDWPIWTCQEQLPPAKFVFDDDGRRGMALDSLVSGGCIVSGTRVKTSVLFNNVHTHSCSDIEECIVLDNAVIGGNCRIRRTIIDSGCHVPPGSVIGYDAEEDARRFILSPNGVVLVTQEMLSRVAAEEQLAMLSAVPGVPTGESTTFLSTGSFVSVEVSLGRSDFNGNYAW